MLDIDDPEASALYARKLVLVRPDRHVAWRGDAVPDDPLDLIDHLRGARLSMHVNAMRDVSAASAAE